MDFESDPKCRLYVGNLSYTLSEKDVENMFGTVGNVLDVYLPRIYQTKKRKGFGFVEMETSDDAFAAIALLHETEDLNGRKLVVRFADIRRSSEELSDRRKKQAKS
jgi:cold-inducible RNA-binding protein